MSANDAASEATKLRRRMVLNQRRQVLLFLMAMAGMAAFCTLQRWHEVLYGPVHIAATVGSQTGPGKICLLAIGVAFFFASYNFLDGDEIDKPVLAASLVAFLAIVSYLYGLWNNETLFKEMTKLANFKEAVEKNQAPPESRLRIAMTASYWCSLTGCLNMGLSALYLAVFHPRLEDLSTDSKS